MKKYEVDSIVKATVSGIESYGIFVTIDDDYTGLIHISEVSEAFVKNINDYASIDEKILVKILEIDASTRKMKLSIKDIKYRLSKGRRALKESGKGFEILENNLPIWIEKKLKEYK